MKRMKRALSVLLAAVLLLPLCRVAAAETEQPTGQVVFQGTAPDSTGYFTLTLTMKDVTFRVFQFALRYDPSVVEPVDETGKPASDFSGFARKNPEASWLSTVGTGLNRETGLIDLSGYIMPGTSGPGINAAGEMTVGQDGILIYTFCFKTLKAGDAGFQIAAQEKGDPYQPACPDGVIVAKESGSVPVTVSFQLASGQGTGGSESFTGDGGTVQPEKTVDKLIDSAVFLPIGSHAALVKGGVTAIYPGEPGVTAYIKGNRTYVPIRFVAERMGAEVAWESDTRTAVVKNGAHTVRIAIGSATYTVDGVVKQLDAPAEMVHAAAGYGRTMVPIRFIAEGLGYQVEWDNADRMVVVGDGAIQWDIDGAVEQQALSKALSLIQLYQSFV